MELQLDHAPCIYFSCKDDGTLIDVNSTLCLELDFTKTELQGKKVDEIFTIATRIFQQTHFFPLLKMHGHAEEVFVTLQTKDKKHLPVLINAHRKEVNGEVLNIHVGIIVHNRKKFEDELIAAKKEAQNALNENSALIQAKHELHQHMEQLDHQIQLVKKQNGELRQFNRVVTHDLQEPLRKLSFFSNILFDEKGSQSVIAEKILRVSEQMRSIIYGLQQYVWLTETDPNLLPVNLHSILLIVQQQLAKDFPGIILKIDKVELPIIQADPEQMKALFYNILSNVIMFRKPGSEAYVQIKVQSLMLNKFRNIKEKYRYTEFLRMEITDHGIGFNPLYADQVFELFKKLHSHSGYGVGLALCKKIVENHEGLITIESKVGEGTTVIIELPMKLD